MELKVIFDVATKPFDWQPIATSMGIFLLSCVAIVFERLKLGYTPIKRIGYVGAFVAVAFAGYSSLQWAVSRRDHMKALENGQFQVLQGPVEHFHPMYYEGRKEESFTISGRTFSYSDHVATTCFNQPAAHGGPIRTGISLRIKFTDECILEIEGLPTNPKPDQP